MTATFETSDPSPQRAQPSPWVQRYAPLVEPAGPVLDLAAGSGRHTIYFNDLGHPVLAIDRDTSGLEDLRSRSGIEIMTLDLEAGDLAAGDLAAGGCWPLPGRSFAGIVVTNYLHRPLLAQLAGALRPGGVLIYETFASGNERFGRPSNPDFLLEPGELLDLARTSGLTVIAYEYGEVSQPKPAIIQHIVAKKYVGSIS